MSQQDLTDPTATPTTRSRNEAETETIRRSGATVVFWILVVFLVCLGLCVLLSLILVIVNGA